MPRIVTSCPAISNAIVTLLLNPTTRDSGRNRPCDDPVQGTSRATRKIQDSSYDPNPSAATTRAYAGTVRKSMNFGALISSRIRNAACS